MGEWRYRFTIFNLGTRWIKRLGSEIKQPYENHEGSAGHMLETPSHANVLEKEEKRYRYYGFSPPNRPIQGSEK
jgi:hypothetical protein